MLGTYLEKDEVIQVLICAVAISIAFALLFAGIEGLAAYPLQFMLLAFISLVTIGSGFILHEMGHKLTAIMYGAKAKYQMWIQGLALMMITSLFGLLFAAPGAVYIFSDKITRKQNGLISLSGPAINLVLMAIFLGLSALVPVRHYLPFEYVRNVNVWLFGAQLNLILALFNMIPVFPLDGGKVMAWSRGIWLTTTGVLLIVASILISPAYIIGWVIMFIIIFILSRLVFR